MKLLIIIPAYNEEDNIKRTIENIEQNAPQYDYVIINDCSTDSTKAICEENGFHVVNLPCNLGIGGAVQTGYIYALENGYDLAVQVDGDGQHDAQFLMEMENYLTEHQCNMVIGSRFINKEGFQSSGLRRIGIRYFTWLIRLLTGKTITDATSGLRMVDREVMELFAKDYPKDYPEPESVTKVIKKGKKVCEIPVIMKERQGGVSSISPGKSVYYMIKVTLAVILAAF
ncbi:MAG: glycosyltransferase family 2 protein [Lachnospiraceae bacterium]|jgi:glycosyltransferase involved in cell wall biosynthesis